MDKKERINKTFLYIFLLVGFLIMMIVVVSPDIYYSSDSSLINLTTTNNYTYLNISSSPPYDALIYYFGFDIDEENTLLTTAFDYVTKTGIGNYTGDTYSNSTGCIFGDCLYLDGSGDYVSFGSDVRNDLSRHNNFSVSLWFNTNDLPSGRFTLLNSQKDTDDKMIIQYVYGVMVVGTFSSAGALEYKSVGFSSANSWHHIVMINNDSGVFGYLDNVEMTGNDAPTSGNLVETYIGRATNGNYQFNGSIDELMIFNRSLNDTQRTEIYENQSNRFISSGDLTFNPISVGSTTNKINFSIEDYEIISDSNISVGFSKWNETFGYDETDFDNLNGLVSYYHFDEDSYDGTTGEVIDSMGLNNGSRSGSADTSLDSDNEAWYRTLTLDGDNDFLHGFGSNLTDTLSKNNNFSISVWVNFDLLPDGRQTIISSSISVDDKMGIQYVFGNLIVATGNSTLYLRKSTTFSSTNAWHHIIMINNDSGVFGYLDNVEMTSDVVPSLEYYSGGTLVGVTGGFVYDLDGYIDELMIFNRSLTSNDIERLYYNGKANYIVVDNYQEYKPNINISINVSTTRKIRPKIKLDSSSYNFITPNIYGAISYDAYDSYSVSVDFPFDNVVIQKNASNYGNLTINGSVEYGGTSVTVNWSGASSGSQEINVVDERYLGHISLIKGLYNLTIYITGDSQYQTNITNIGVGDVIVISGQSNAVETGGETITDYTAPYQVWQSYTNGIPTSWKNYTWAQMPNSRRWSELTYYASDIGNQPVMLINFAVGGTGIINLIGGGKYYEYGIQRINYFTGGTMDIKGVIFNQGESDIIGGMSESDYFSNLQNMTTSFNNDLNIESEKIVIDQTLKWGTDDLSPTSIRKAQQRSWTEISNAYRGAIFYDIQLDVGAVHPTGSQKIEYQRRLSESGIEQIYFNSTFTPSEIRSVQRASSTAINIIYTLPIIISNWTLDEDAKAYGIILESDLGTLTDDNVISTIISSDNLSMNVTFDSDISNYINISICTNFTCYGKPIVRTLSNNFPVPILYQTEILDGFMQTTYYVNMSGDDTGTGTVNDPFRTLTVAISNSGVDDLIIISDGRYYEPEASSNIGLYISGKNGLTIRSENLHGAIISVNDTSGAQALKRGIYIQSHNVTLDGLWINGTGWNNANDGLIEMDECIYIREEYHGAHLYNLRFDDCTTSISIINNWAETVDNVEIINSTFNKGRIETNQGFMNNFLIKNNTFNMTSDNIYIIWQPSDNGATGQPYGENFTIEDNIFLIRGAGTLTAIKFHELDATGHGNVIIRNNQFGTEDSIFNGNAIDILSSTNMNISNNSFFVTAGKSSIQVTDNLLFNSYIEDNTFGSINYGLDNIDVIRIGACENCSISRNIIYHNSTGETKRNSIIRVGDYNGINSTNVTIGWNNITSFASLFNMSYGIGLGMDGSFGSYNENMIIENNVINFSSTTVASGAIPHVLFMGYTEGGIVRNNYVVGGQYVVIKQNRNVLVYNNEVYNVTLGIYDKGGINGSFYNNIISGGSYNIYVDWNDGKLQNTINSTWWDSTISSATSSAVYIQDNSSVIILNISYSDNEFVGTSSNLTRKWYFETNISNSINVMENVGVNITNSQGNNVLSKLTDAGGGIGKEKLIEYINNGTKNYATPHEVNLSIENYWISSIDYNLTALQISEGDANIFHSVILYENGMPTISFDDTTAQNGTTQSSTSILVNITSADAEGDHYAFVDFDNDLVGWWRAEGDATDDSSYGNDGTLTNGASIIDSSYFGKGFSFDGDDDYISLGDVPELENMAELTISTWVNFNSMDTPDRKIIAKSQAYALLIDSDPGDNSFYVYLKTDDDAWAIFQPGIALSRNDWHHVAMTYKSGELKLYVDGSQYGTTSTDWTGDISQNTNPVEIGGNWLTEFNGTIDDILMFNRTLSATEIKSLYNTSANSYENNFTGLSYGTHNFTGYAVDKAGNRNDTGEWSVTIENVAPSITILYPTNDLSISGSQDIPINFSITDDNLDTCWYNIKKSDGNYDISNTTISCSTNYTFNVSLYDTFNLTLYANDTLGLENKTWVSFIVIQPENLIPPTHSGGSNPQSTFDKTMVCDYVEQFLKEHIVSEGFSYFQEEIVNLTNLINVYSNPEIQLSTTELYLKNFENQCNRTNPTFLAIDSQVSNFTFITIHDDNATCNGEINKEAEINFGFFSLKYDMDWYMPFITIDTGEMTCESLNFWGWIFKYKSNGENFYSFKGFKLWWILSIGLFTFLWWFFIGKHRENKKINKLLDKKLRA